MSKSSLSFLHSESGIIHLNKRKKAPEDKVRNLICSDAVSHFSGDVRNRVLTHKLSAFLWAYYSSQFWNAWFLRVVQEHHVSNRKLLHNISVLYLYVVLIQRGIQLLPSSSVPFHTWYKSLKETTEHVIPRCCRCKLCEGQKQALVALSFTRIIRQYGLCLQVWWLSRQYSDEAIICKQTAHLHKENKCVHDLNKGH